MNLQLLLYIISGISSRNYLVWNLQMQILRINMDWLYRRLKYLYNWSFIYNMHPFYWFKQSAWCAERVYFHIFRFGVVPVTPAGPIFPSRVYAYVYVGKFILATRHRSITDYFDDKLQSLQFLFHSACSNCLELLAHNHHRWNIELESYFTLGKFLTRFFNFSFWHVESCCIVVFVRVLFTRIYSRFDLCFQEPNLVEFCSIYPYFEFL